MNELPHGLTPEDLQDELDRLDSNIQVGPDITYEEYVHLIKYMLRRRRRAGVAGLVSVLTVSPGSPSVPTGSAIGTLVATLGVNGGFGTYTYSFISNPGGYFSISGNQILVAATLPSPQSITVQVQANNGLGDQPALTFPIVITTAGYIPTYPYYGF